MYCGIFLIIFGCVGVLHLLFILREYPSGRHATKVLLIPSLILWVYFVHPVYLLLLALFWGWVGDVLLIKKDRRLFLKLGLLAFLLGHIAYSTVFLLHTPAFPGVVLSVGIVCAYILFGLGMFRTLRSGLGRMRLPVGFYIFAISCMSATALFFALSVGGQAWASFAGSVLFLLSDSLLAFQLFRTPFKHGRLLVMVSYIPAQLFLAWGILNL